MLGHLSALEPTAVRAAELAGDGNVGAGLLMLLQRDSGEYHVTSTPKESASALFESDRKQKSQLSTARLRRSPTDLVLLMLFAVSELVDLMAVRLGAC